jgi:DNA polymerase III psi subunit
MLRQMVSRPVRLVLLSERTPHINKPQLSDINKNLILSPKWLHDCEFLTSVELHLCVIDTDCVYEVKN